MGKLTISMAIFNSYVKLPEGTYIYTHRYIYIMIYVCICTHTYTYIYMPQWTQIFYQDQFSSHFIAHVHVLLLFSAAVTCGFTRTFFVSLVLLGSLQDSIYVGGLAWLAYSDFLWQRVWPWLPLEEIDRYIYIKELYILSILYIIYIYTYLYIFMYSYLLHMNIYIYIHTYSFISMNMVMINQN